MNSIEQTRMSPEAGRKIVGELVKIEDRRGINTGRLERFWATQEVELLPHFFIPNNARAELYKIFQRNLPPEVFVANAPSDVTDGFSNAEFAVVFRKEENEFVNGVELSESLMVHELTHLKSFSQTLDGSNIRRQGPTTIRMRSGSLVRTGHFFSEGEAEYQRARYLQENNIAFVDPLFNNPYRTMTTEVDITEIPQVIGHGDDGRVGRDILPVTLRLSDLYPYLSKDSHTGEVCYPVGAVAAISLLKIENYLKDKGDGQSIFGAFSMCPKPEGLKTVRNILEGITPGLYAGLRDINYDMASFYLGYDLVDRGLEEKKI